MDVVLNELFGSRMGLLVLFTIGFIIVMGVYIWVRIAKLSRDPNA